MLRRLLPKAASLQHLLGLAEQVLAITVWLFRKHKAPWEAYRCLLDLYTLMTKLLIAGVSKEQGEHSSGCAQVEDSYLQDPPCTKLEEVFIHFSQLWEAQAALKSLFPL